MTASVAAELLDAAASTPDRDAYVLRAADGTRTATSYAALADRALRLAGALGDLGVAKGDVVGVLLPNGADFAAVYLAALRLGAVTSALNLRTGPLERAHVVARTEPVVTIAADGVDVPDGAGRVVRAPELAALATHDPLPDSVAEPRPDDPVAVVWTSGTTGAPKGAVYDTAAMAEISRGMGDLTADGDRRLVGLPFPHVGYMTRVLDELVHRTTLVLTPDPWSAAAMLATIEAERVTVGTGVPTQWQLALDHPATATTDFSSLRLAGIGAATIPPALVARMRGVLGCPVVTRYTSTEAGITTGTRVTDPPEVVAHTVGVPSPVVELRIVDEHGHVVPSGEVGEVRCRSRAMFRGYWRDPELTAAALDAEGFLRTGDLGFVDDRGDLRLVGRLKEMYVRGGYNVYPAEVEGVLAGHPAVAAVAVVGAPAPVLGEVGVAFVVPAPGASDPPTLDDLRAWCRARLADYKAPDRLVVVDALPVTAMAKVDKRALTARLEQER